jgi:hypothetical protein
LRGVAVRIADPAGLYLAHAAAAVAVIRVEVIALFTAHYYAVSAARNYAFVVAFWE